MDCNELYLVEERPSDSQTDLKTFGEPDDIIEPRFTREPTQR
jgi:hypothetical protein